MKRRAAWFAAAGAVACAGAALAFPAPAFACAALGGACASAAVVLAAWERERRRTALAHERIAAETARLGAELAEETRLRLELARCVAQVQAFARHPDVGWFEVGWRSGGVTLGAAWKTWLGMMPSTRDEWIAALAPSCRESWTAGPNTRGNAGLQARDSLVELHTVHGPRILRVLAVEMRPEEGRAERVVGVALPWGESGAGEYSAAPSDAQGVHACLPTAPERPAERRPTPPQLPPDAPRVLVVDDTPTNRQVALLQVRRCNARCEEARGAREALERVLAGDFDVVLMDCHMPEIDGYEATARLHAAWRASGRPESARPRIVAVTASALAGDRERCLAAGMDDYLPKPVLLDQLRATIQRHVAERRGGLAEHPVVAPAHAAGDAAGDLDFTHLEGMLLDRDGQPDPDALAVFHGTAADLVARVAGLAALRGHDLAEAAHKLRGTASVFGMRRLVGILREVESSAVQGGADAATDRADEAAEAARTGCAAVEAWLAQLPARR